MLRCWLVCLVMMVLMQGKGQIAEDFGDGELQYNPSWNGDTASFAVSYLKELQLMAQQEGEVYLSTGNMLIDSVEWLFRIRLGFSPSMNNYARVYLVADTLDLRGPVNGYYLQFGETGSLDALTLFRQEGMMHTEVCRGESGAVAQAFDLRIRVTRSRDGQWDLFLRTTSEWSYRHQATGIDALIATTRHFGLVCRFTASNKQNFWFDDIYVQHIYQDLLPPALVGLQILSNTSLLLSANEPLHPGWMMEKDNFLLLPPADQPSEVKWADASQESIMLTFPQGFDNPGHYQLKIFQWCDRDSNCTGPLLDSFLYTKARRWDVFFTELMTDPDPPPHGLPAMEYIELYNSSPYPVPLGDWKLVVGNTTYVLKEDTILALGYKLLTPSQAYWGQGVSSQLIKGLSLPNTGASLALWDEMDNPIAFLQYSDVWYDDPFKKEGGWSLEMVAVDHPCLMNGNWKPSNDPSGGTPGKPNSRTEGLSDDEPPNIEYAYLKDDHTLVLVFSEVMNPLSLMDPASFALASSGEQALSIAIHEPECREVTLIFQGVFQTDSIYHMILGEGPEDCYGNKLRQDTLQFGHLAMAGVGDLIIHEILFNPWPGGEDFVEIYNKSSRAIDLSTLRLCALDPAHGDVKSVSQITDKPYSIMPGTYRVFSPGRQAVFSQYPRGDIRAFLPDISSFPSYPDDKGGVGLALYTGEIIDAFLYNKSMHIGFLSDVEGVSLERIDIHQPTMSAHNWHSASEVAGYATPGTKNSHTKKYPVEVASFSLEPKEMSPNNDGWNDFLRFIIYPETPGTKANVWIFNASGRMVKTLCRALLLSEESLLTWAGNDEHQQPVPAGIYILYAEVLGEDGRNQRHKEAFYLIRD